MYCDYEGLRQDLNAKISTNVESKFFLTSEVGITSI